MSRKRKKRRHVNKYGREKHKNLRKELQKVASQTGISVTRVQRYLKGQQTKDGVLSAEEQSAVDTNVGGNRLPQLRDELRTYL